MLSRCGPAKQEFVAAVMMLHVVWLVHRFVPQRRGRTKASGARLGMADTNNLWRVSDIRFLAARLTEAGLPSSLLESPTVPLQGKLVGIVLVRAAKAVSTTLGRNTRELRLLHSALQSPDVFYSLDVVEVVAVAGDAPPVLVFPARADAVFARTPLYAVSEAFIAIGLALLAEGSPNSIGVAIQRWRSLYGSVHGELGFALQAQPLFCELAMKHKWSTFAMLPNMEPTLLKADLLCRADVVLRPRPEHREQQLDEGSESDGPVESKRLGEDVSYAQLSFESFDNLLACLYEWAPAITRSQGELEEDIAEQQLKLETFITFVQQVSDALAPMRANWERWRGRCGYRYTAVGLLTCFLGASLLKSDWKLRQAIEACIRIYFCPAVAKQLIELAKAAHVPSAPVISRFRLRLDVAFMHWVRAKLKPMLERAESSRRRWA